MVMGKYTVGDNSTKSNLSLFHASRCMGEKVLSIKQYLLRNSPIQGYFNTWNFSAKNSFFLFPWFTGVVGMNGTTGNQVCTTIGGDFYNFVAPMYAFYRGGVKIHYREFSAAETHLTSSIVTGQPVVDVSPITNVTPFTNQKYLSGCTPYSDGMFAGQPLITSPDIRNTTYQHVPYYCRFPFSLVNYFDGAGTPTTEYSTPGVAYCCGAPSTQFSVNGSIQRSVMDDFQFMFFTGCPCLPTSFA